MKKTKYIIALLVAAISFALPAQAQERILTAIGATGKTELKVANDIKNLYFANKPESKTFKITTNTTVKPNTTIETDSLAQKTEFTSPVAMPTITAKTKSKVRAILRDFMLFPPIGLYILRE